MLRQLVLTTILFATSTALALDEKALPEAYNKLVAPYFASVPVQQMTAKDGLTLRYRYFPAAKETKRTLVIVTGFSESMRKWAELIYDLKESGYSIFIYDHRGQGESDRLLSDDSKKGYVRDFQDWADDLNQFMTEKVKPAAHGDIFMLAHSMGGGIATVYNIQHPGNVKAFVACSPMMAPTLNAFNREFDLPLESEVDVKIDLGQGLGLKTADLLISLGRATRYAPGRSANDWIKDPNDNPLTTSEKRSNYIQQQKVDNPNEIVAAPTVQWVHEAIRLGYFVRKHATELKVPTLIYRASEEKIVESQFFDLFHDQAGAEILEFQGAEHEIFVEQDQYRKVAIENMLKFFAAH